MRKMIVLMIGALLAFGAAPALADDDSGFFVGAEFKFLQPSGAGMPYILIDTNQDSLPGGTYETVDFSNELSYKIWLGQSYGGDAGWAVSYWTFDEKADDTAFADLDTGEAFDILFHPLVGADFFTTDGTSVVSVEANTADLIYWNNSLGTEKLKLTWFTGFRYASLETMQAVDYITFFGDEYADFMNETDGIGFTGGFRGSVRIGERAYLYGGFGYSFLMADVETVTLQGFDRADPAAIDVRLDDERGLSIIETDFGIAWHVTDQVHVHLGYELSRWQDAVTYATFNDDFQLGSTQFSTQDVTFDGFKAGVGFMF